MAKDPGFIFYPGDYLRDTQILSEAVQVAYDRIMCEHMRNICVSYEQLKFFTKKLNADEIAELKSVLVEDNGKGYYIEWVRMAIEKRREYSKSRANNRIGKSKPSLKKKKNISKSYVPHMENENEIEIDDKNAIAKFKPPEQNEVAAYMAEINYPAVVQEESETFVSFYSSKGWMIGKNKMKDWKASVRTWKQKRNERPTSTTKTGSGNDRLAVSLAAIRDNSNMGQG